MEIVILPSTREVHATAARIIAALVRRKPDAVLGLATGATQHEVYAELVRLHRDEGLDFGRVTTFNLDEYVGIPADHPDSFHHYMTEHFFAHVNLAPERVHIPDGMAADIDQECADYEQAICDAGGMDLVLLGIGEDGHIAFNEPTSSLGSRTRLKTLTSGSRHVITMGIGTLLEARRCVMLAWGERKQRAVARMVEGPLTSMVPASALQTHPRATILLDEMAAANLSMAAYFREVHRHKPDWQKERDGV
jgi:glucosamine-6-phosphate deaminase